MTAWFFLGFVLGLFVTGFLVVLHSLYGDPELNEQIEQLRKQRLDLYDARLELEKSRFQLAVIKNVRRLVK